MAALMPKVGLALRVFPKSFAALPKPSNCFPVITGNSQIIATRDNQQRIPLFKADLKSNVVLR